MFRLFLKLFLYALLFSFMPQTSGAIGRLYTSLRLSSSQISCLAQDRYGFIWIGTEYGLDRFDGYTFTNYVRDPAVPGTVGGNVITKFLVDRDGNLWIGHSKGLMRFDYSSNSFSNYAFPHGNAPRVNSLVQASNGDVLIGTAGYGLFSLQGKDGVVREVAMPQGRAQSDRYFSRMFLDSRKGLWRASHSTAFTRYEERGGKLEAARSFTSPMGLPVDFIQLGRDRVVVVCSGGALCYDYRTGRMSDAGFDFSVLGGNVDIRCALADGHGNIYFGTSGKGLVRIRRGKAKAEPVADSEKGFSLAQSNVCALLNDRAGNIWVGCYNKGLYQMGMWRTAFRGWNFSTQNINTGGGVSAAAPGDGGTVLCTVQNSGVYVFDAKGSIVAHPSSPDGASTIYRSSDGRYWLGTQRSVYAYNPRTGTATLALSLSGRGVNAIVGDGKDRLFVSDFGKGLCVFDTRTGKSESLSMGSKGYKRLCNDWIKYMAIDRSGILWLCTANGLQAIDVRRHGVKVVNPQALLNGLACTAICEVGGGMAIGTDAGAYFYDRRSRKVSRLKGADALANLMVCGMATDAKGNLWISSTRGIWMWNPHTARLSSHLNDLGTTTREYVQGAVLKGEGGIIGFGTSDGITTFMPSDVTGNRTKMGQVFLTDFSAGGKWMDIRQERFDVPYNENTISLRFSLLDFKNTDMVSFRYKIDGARNWLSTEAGSNLVTLGNLPPGKHTIRVRAFCNGELSKGEKTLTIVVESPWYASWWAWTAYILAVAALAFFAFRSYERRRKSELEESKMRFLMNATHDIRSPLTLIMGPLAKLKNIVADADGKSYIETIDRNAQRLLTLVNQILDERKIDKNQMRLHCLDTDIVGLVNGVYSLYQYNASQHGIGFTFEHGEEPVRAWVDRANFEKVVSNLLSNAFKHTPDGGSITVSLASDGKQFKMAVADTGIGIKEDKPERLFERFYQSDYPGRSQTPGTGIGLNLSREIVMMHGGRITAANRADGQSGAVFTVTVPCDKEHLKPEYIGTDVEKAEEPKAKTRPSKNIRVLVADDNRDLSHYIASELGGYYRFETFENGKEALDALLRGKFDIVVSDVMMPVTDGIALLKNIKKNSNISDIPVVLLTSKTDVEDRLEGLKGGADAYLGKPFDMEELHAVIENLVENTRRLKGKFSGMQEQKDKVEDIEVSGNDEVAMERIMKSINQNLGDSDFNVERLAADIGMSRTQLHRKMKELTGIPTSEFIRNIRLEQAAKLLREGKINVTQITYQVGFNSQTHFSTLFKKHFGMTPSEYAEKKKGQDA